MKQRVPPRISRIDYFYCVLAILCSTAMVSLGQNASAAQTQPVEAQSAVQQTTATESDVPPIPNDQLDALVAPIALFPDPLLAQTLAASTYPLEVIQLQQWMEQNKNLKDKALADAVAKQPWDPSIQALAIVPDVVQRLAGNITWTTDLGNAFLAQQSDVMDAVQRMRGKAENKGALKTSEQQVVETKTVEGGKQVIEIQPAQADVVYVPSYDPVVVYGSAPIGYPYYPYSYPGYYPGMGLAWGAAGFALGAWAGGNWGNCNWGGGDININRNNNFNRNSNRNVNRGQGGRGNGWQHNPSHRGNAPYGDRGTANKFGGAARGERGTGNRGGAGNRPGGGGAGVANRPGAGAGNRPGAGAGNRPGAGAGNRPGAGAGNRPGGGAGTKPANRASGGAAARPGGGSGGRASSTKPANRPSSGSSANRVGNRSVPSGNKSGGSAFGSSGRSGSSSRAASSRGGHSMGGGGASRGGGSRGGGGGHRGGGGGGRRR